MVSDPESSVDHSHTLVMSTLLLLFQRAVLVPSLSIVSQNDCKELPVMKLFPDKVSTTLNKHILFQLLNLLCIFQSHLNVTPESPILPFLSIKRLCEKAILFIGSFPL